MGFLYINIVLKMRWLPNILLWKPFLFLKKWVYTDSQRLNMHLNKFVYTTSSFQTLPIWLLPPETQGANLRAPWLNLQIQGTHKPPFPRHGTPDPFWMVLGLCPRGCACAWLCGPVRARVWLCLCMRLCVAVYTYAQLKAEWEGGGRGRDG